MGLEGAQDAYSFDIDYDRGRRRSWSRSPSRPSQRYSIDWKKKREKEGLILGEIDTVVKDVDDLHQHLHHHHHLPTINPPWISMKMMTKKPR